VPFFYLEQMFYKQKLFFITLTILLVAFINFSCEKERLEPVKISKDENFTFHMDDSLNVSGDLAITAAFNFGNNSRLMENGSNLRTQSVEIEGLIIIPDEQGEPAIYIINYVGNGYLILSATLKESPVLGFSASDYFDIENIPLGMAEWFYDRMNKIQTIRNDSAYKIPETIFGEWADVLETEIKTSNRNGRIAATIEQFGPLLSTLWGQGIPFNDQVPLNGCSNYSNNKAPTGCVATAVAQVARYHAKGTKYNWSIMPNSIWSGRSNAGDREVALLMKDIGSWIGMNYSCEGSGAWTENAVGVFRDRLGYTNGGVFRSLTTEVAEIIVKDDIKNGRPVIMDGYHSAYTYTTGWWLWENTHTHTV
jgi:hypothetical protein